MSLVTRVRYTKANSDGVRKSITPLVSESNGSLTVVLNRTNNTFDIVNAEGTALDSGGENSYQTLLKTVKVKLQDLGVQFGSETRRERTGGQTEEGQSIAV